MTEEKNQINQNSILNLRKEVLGCYKNLPRPILPKFPMPIISTVVFILFITFVSLYLRSGITLWALIPAGIVFLVVFLIYIKKHGLQAWREGYAENKKINDERAFNFYEAVCVRLSLTENQHIEVFDGLIHLFRIDLEKRKEERLKPFGIVFVLGFSPC